MSSSFDDATVRTLNELTSAFYAREAASFSATRQAPWQGWCQALSAIAEVDPDFSSRPLSVLDLGCGNLRFERFLAEHVSAPLSVHAVDNCAPLAKQAAIDFPAIPLPAQLDVAPLTHQTPASSVAPASSATPTSSAAPTLLSSSAPILPPAPTASAAGASSLDFREIDLVDALLESGLHEALPDGACDLAVAFGVMHHLPRFDLRAQMLACLGRSLRPGGFGVISFWQFLDDPRLAAKAERTTAEGRAAYQLPSFGPRDALLPWQRATGVYRFCHHCDEAEIDQLVAEAQLAAPLQEVARFSADGKSGTLNRYVVLRIECAL